MESLKSFKLVSWRLQGSRHNDTIWSWSSSFGIGLVQLMTQKKQWIVKATIQVPTKMIDNFSPQITGYGLITPIQTICKSCANWLFDAKNTSSSRALFKIIIDPKKMQGNMRANSCFFFLVASFALCAKKALNKFSAQPRIFGCRRSLDKIKPRNGCKKTQQQNTHTCMHYVCTVWHTYVYIYIYIYITFYFYSIFLNALWYQCIKHLVHIIDTISILNIYRYTWHVAAAIGCQWPLNCFLCFLFSKKSLGGKKYQI